MCPLSAIVSGLCVEAASDRPKFEDKAFPDATLKSSPFLMVMDEFHFP